MTDSAPTIGTVAGDIMQQHPELMAHLQNRLGSLVGRSSGYVESLPGEVHRRLDALKNLQDSTNQLSLNFRKEVIELEKKYLALAQPIYQKRYEIVTGEVEPTDEEVTRGTKDDDEEPIERLPISEKDPVKGIPEFWLTAFKTMPIIADMITDEDEPALRHLTNIKLDYLDNNPGFKLTFTFSPNEYFSNNTLVKTYYLDEPEDPRFGDALYDRAEATTIQWKEGKDLSVKVEIKKQRHKATNKTRTVKKTVPKDTFFNFFKPPTVPEEDEELEEEQLDELNERVQFDYEVGEAIKERLIPHAIDWFTGKALEYDDEDEEDYDDFDEDDEEGDEDDEDEDEDEEDVPPPRAVASKKKGGSPNKTVKVEEGNGPAQGGASDEKPPECKQQ